MTVATENTALLTDVTAQAQALHEEDAAQPTRVCFVCTGNTCRSPMAEAVANALAAEEAERMAGALPEGMRDCIIPRIEVCSAGLYPIEGDPIASNAVAALEEAGVRAIPSRDYHNHLATALTEQTVNASDLLVGMSGSHVMELFMRYPQAAQKIVCMPQAISDPFGGDLARYRACLAEITEGVRALLFGETGA